LPHFSKRHRLVVLLGLVTVLALVLGLNATKIGGQQPAEPFRIPSLAADDGWCHAEPPRLKPCR